MCGVDGCGCVYEKLLLTSRCVVVCGVDGCGCVWCG